MQRDDGEVHIRRYHNVDQLKWIHQDWEDEVEPVTIFHVLTVTIISFFIECFIA